MKPAPFRYLRPGSLDEVLSLLAEYGDEAKLLAGGQSLIPMMNFRLSQPAVLIDLELVGELGRLEREDGALAVGAMVRQRLAERSPDIRECAPLVAAALPWVGHVGNRNRGTVGGSIAHADPAAELPAVALALEAEMVIASSRGVRTVPARDFFQGPFATAVRADEILTSVRFPVLPNAGVACLEIARRHGDFALVGVAAVARFAQHGGVVEDVALAAFGVSGKPVRLAEAEASLSGRELTRREAEAAGAASAAELRSPRSDIHASGDYRRDALGALVARALDGLAQERRSA